MTGSAGLVGFRGSGKGDAEKEAGGSCAGGCAMGSSCPAGVGRFWVSSTL